MTINVYDADTERSSIPVYLDFDNLIQEVNVEELTDEMATAIRPYGADDLDIRAVNPIGTNWCMICRTSLPMGISLLL